MAIILQYIIVSYPFRYLACFKILALGAYLIAVTMAKAVVDDIKSTNDKITKQSKNDLSKKFIELINLNSDAKQ